MTIQGQGTYKLAPFETCDADQSGIPHDAIRLSPENAARQTNSLPLRARLALRALVRLPRGTLTLTLPDGRTFVVGGNGPGPEARATLHNWNLAARAFSAGTVGVAETYLDGDWESPDLTAFLELFVANREERELVAGGASRIVNALMRMRHWLNENTPRRARRNISAHYDLGNAFYEKWLDASMTYSSALFEEGANDLLTAQKAKYAALAQATGIGPDDHVLEIGCGWGGFAEYAAREIGCRVTGLTISREQHDYATRRMALAGLSDRVEIRFQDYRDERGTYDRIVSIEMFEAVGEKYWPVYFSKLREVLKPGGTAGLQIITINEESYDSYRSQPDFIQRYIFPGGMLPAPSHLAELGQKNGLALTEQRIFPQDYARTLAEWRDRFLAAWHDIAGQGFDERFRRLWTFYLSYCEAGFRDSYIDVRQLVYGG